MGLIFTDPIQGTLELPALVDRKYGGVRLDVSAYRVRRDTTPLTGKQDTKSEFCIHSGFTNEISRSLNSKREREGGREREREREGEGEGEGAS